ncbi:MAG: SCO family protein [Acidimicrobiia bacterium]|nr:SCO family protein [Acidimicrobiia bacterium]
MKRAIVSITLLGVLAAACSSGPAELAGYVRTPAPNSADISLPDATAGGAPFFLRAPDGELLLVYFGYTACPDVCPTTLADIRTALADLGDGAASIELAMITVDPDRDTGEILAGYVQSFVPAAHGLRTDDDAVLSDAAFVLGAAYEVDVTDEGVVEVLHTAHIYVIDDTGALLVTWPFGIEPGDMTSDLRILLDR